MYILPNSVIQYLGGPIFCGRDLMFTDASNHGWGPHLLDYQELRYFRTGGSNFTNGDDVDILEKLWHNKI